MSGQFLSCLKEAPQRLVAQAVNLSNWIYQFRTRITKVLVFFAIYSLYSWVINNPVWLYVVNHFGYVEGNLIMMATAFPHNFFLLYVYNKYQKDLLEAKAIDKAKSRLANWVGKYSKFSHGLSSLAEKDVFVFLFFSIAEDSFITTIMLRKGSFEPFEKRDYQIFLASTAFSCLYWAGRNLVLLIALKYLFNF